MSSLYLIGGAIRLLLVDYLGWALVRAEDY